MTRAEIEVRRAGPENLDDIAAIQAASPDASSWQPESYLAHDCLVASVDGVTTGFIVTRRTGPGETEILNLAVAPQWRRKGVARALVGEVLGGLTGSVFLEVRESNTAARKLYVALGFLEIGLRRNYYHTPPEAAIVMRL